MIDNYNVFKKDVVFIIYGGEFNERILCCFYIVGCYMGIDCCGSFLIF